MEQAVSNQINTTKLLAVEKLLWGHTPKKPGEGMQGMRQIAGLVLQHLVVVPCQHTTMAGFLFHNCITALSWFTGFGSRMRARAAHRLLVVAAQYISFDATNIQLVYKQTGMPGPRPTADSPLQGMDAVCLNVRKLSLNPLGKPLCTYT